MAAPPIYTYGGGAQQQQQQQPAAVLYPPQLPQHQQHQQHQQQQRWLRDLELPPHDLQLLSQQNISSVRELLAQSPLDLCERLNIPLTSAQRILQAVSLQAAPPFTTALLLHNTLHQHSVKLLTGLPALDAGLRIGVPPAAITELVGQAGVGKSQFCYSLALQAAMPQSLGGLAATLMYIDTEGKFSSERLQEMVAARVAAAPAAAVASAAAASGGVCPLQPQQPQQQQQQQQQAPMQAQPMAAAEVVDQVLNRVLVLRAHSAEQLQQQLGQLAVMVPQRDVKLVILDSIAALLRTAELSGTGGTGGTGGAPTGGGAAAAAAAAADGAAALAARGELLGRQASVLKAVAEGNRIPVVVTNQVTARVSGPAVHAFQQQQQPHQQQPAPLQQAQAQAQAQAQQPYGDSTAASRDGALSAALGTKWAHAVNVRLVLERRQAGRFVTIAKSPLSANVTTAYTISAAGVTQAGAPQPL